jgi:6-phosphogluconate dehydrogenase
MDIGMVGLGRMGGNMARRLIRGGHRVVGWATDAAAVAALEAGGGVGARTLADLVAKLPAPRAVWVMVPAGDATEQTVRALADLLSPGDTVVDGGNSFFKDDVRRGKLLAAKGIRFLDAGTSGGVLGLDRGYCLMVGGDAEAFRRLEPIFRTLAPGKGTAAPTPGRAASGSAEEGYLHTGPSGSGHFVKMIHNGIEYGLMQAFAEGFDVLRGAGGPEVAEELRYSLDLKEIAELWRRGSVVSSWLLDLAAAALAKDPRLDGFTGAVADSGEGRWTVQAAVEEAVPAPVLAASLFARFRSRQETTFGDKLLSAMRREFGGHAEAARLEGKP